MVRFAKQDFAGRFNVKQKVGEVLIQVQEDPQQVVTGPALPKHNQDWCKVGWVWTKDVGRLLFRETAKRNKVVTLLTCEKRTQIPRPTEPLRVTRRPKMPSHRKTKRKKERTMIDPSSAPETHHAPSPPTKGEAYPRNATQKMREKPTIATPAKPSHRKTRWKKKRPTNASPFGDAFPRVTLTSTQAWIKQCKEMEKKRQKQDIKWTRAKQTDPSKHQDFYKYNDLTEPKNHFLPKISSPHNTKNRRYVKGNRVGLESYKYAVECLLNRLQILPVDLPRAKIEKIPGGFLTNPEFLDVVE